MQKYILFYEAQKWMALFFFNDFEIGDFVTYEFKPICSHQKRQDEKKSWEKDAKDL